jgi:glucose-1-phosphate thymidylyltransferase
LYPIGFRRDERTGALHAKVASHDLFEKFRRAGISIAYVILRKGKWDIPAYFGDGEVVGLKVAYVVIQDSLGPPDTLDRAFPFVRSDVVAFGFPDIQFGPDDVFRRLLDYLRTAQSDLVLGLYPAADVRLMDMVDFTDEGRIRSIVLKPASSDLRYAWLCAVWTPTFTQFMHAFVGSERARAKVHGPAYHDIDAQGDFPVGAVIKAAVEAGLRVHGLTFPNDSYLDVGTPNSLIEAVRRSTAEL